MRSRNGAMLMPASLMPPDDFRAYMPISPCLRPPAVQFAALFAMMFDLRDIYEIYFCRARCLLCHRMTFERCGCRHIYALLRTPMPVDIVFS